MDIRQIRDITIIDFDKDRYMGIACDSCGGIGYKEHDLIKASPQITAYETGKVVLAELMSMGFTPAVLANGLAVEMNDTGRHLIEGFNELLSKLSSKVHLTGSTEENIQTVQTSLGITCIGFCEKSKLKYKLTSEGDLCLLVGLPLVGNEVLNNPDKVLDIDDFEKMFGSDYVKEMLPVGSRGVEAELNDMLEYNNLGFKYADNISIDLKKSGGPSCSCIISIEEKNIHLLKNLTTKPIEIIGKYSLN